MLTIKYNDPFTGLAHIVSAEEVIVKQGESKDEYILSIYVPRSEMFVNITVKDESLVSVFLKHLYEENKADFSESEYPIEIAFKEKHPSKEVEMYAVNLDSLLGPDYSDNGYDCDPEIDLNPFFNLFFGDEDNFNPQEYDDEDN